MSKYNLLDIHEGMGYKEFSNSKEEERLDKHPDKMMIKKVKAMMAKEKAVKEGEAVDLAIEASQEKAGIKTENVIKEEADPIEAEMKMHLKQYNAGEIDGDDLARAFDEILNGRISPPGERGFNTTYGMEESFDSLSKKLDKQKGIDKEEAGKIAGKIANIKRKGGGKGPTAKQKKRMTEVRIDRDVAERIESMLDISMKAKFLDAFMEIYENLLEEDMFYPEDIINHLNNEMHAELDGYQRQGDRLAGIGESSDKYVDEIGEGAMQPGEGDLESGQTGNMDAYTEEIDTTLDPYEDRDEIIKQVKSLLVKEKGASEEELKGFIETHMEDILNAKDDDDIVDEFLQYLSVNEGNKALKEHFGRFMKDYQ